MKSIPLLPHRFKMFGWVILIPATALGLFLLISGFEFEGPHWKMLSLYHEEAFSISNHHLQSHRHFFTWVETGIFNTLAGAAFIIGGLLVGFSREKTEDEFIARLRLSSLMWAVWISYILLLLAFLLFYGIFFLNVMVISMFLVLIIFIVRFHFLLYKNEREAGHEE